jgi:hypothetical protein
MIEPVQTPETVTGTVALTPRMTGGCSVRELPTRTNPCHIEGFRDPRVDHLPTRREDRTLAVLGHVEKLVSSVAQLITAIMHLTKKEPPTLQPTSGSPTHGTPPNVEPDFTKPIPKPPSGIPLATSGEFLWKPASERDNKLVILLPSSLTSLVKSVQIISPKAKKVLETGAYSGIGNGQRTHFRFKKSGGSYPDGSIVLITLNDGSRRHVKIKNTEVRFTK